MVVTNIWNTLSRNIFYYLFFVHQYFLFVFPVKKRSSKECNSAVCQTTAVFVYRGN